MFAWPVTEFRGNRELMATLRAEGCVLGEGSAGNRAEASGLYQSLPRKAPEAGPDASPHNARHRPLEPFTLPHTDLR